MLKNYKEIYFVNANRPNHIMDFVFPEYEAFEELERGIFMLNTMGYEITLITLIIEEV